VVEDILLSRLWSKHLCVFCHEHVKLMLYVGNKGHAVKRRT
jgi:hypothetical protein